MVSLHAEGNLIPQESQQSETPSATPPATAVATGHQLHAAAFLRKIADWDGNSWDVDQMLIAAFEADDYLDCVNDLKAQNIDPLSYINSLDEVSSYSIPKAMRLAHSDVGIDDRHPSDRFKSTKTMHTRVEKDLWFTWSPAYFPYRPIPTC